MLLNLTNFCSQISLNSSWFKSFEVEFSASESKRFVSPVNKVWSFQFLWIFCLLVNLRIVIAVWKIYISQKEILGFHFFLVIISVSLYISISQSNILGSDVFSVVINSPVEGAITFVNICGKQNGITYLQHCFYKLIDQRF